MQTEQQNPRSMQLDQSSTLDVLRIMNEEDQKVALVVQDALPQIAAAVDVIAERMARGGRLFYVGAGTSGRLGVLDAVECVPTFSTEPEQVQGLIAGGERAFVRAVEG
ncbi:MAG: N-acetylmuramic acid 6-phosphate etherase, partial [Anaerolineae bacterium]|nr:N-acetylmuramic acid 6-phosphate etherase [Anaerolineae bacterium]